MAAALLDALRKLQESTMTVMNKAVQNPDEAGAAAADYLRLFGLVASGWMWLRMAQVAVANAGEARYDAKLKTARFYFTKLLPQAAWLASAIATGAGPVMELDAAAF